MLASLLRLGFVANFISEPVLVGFKAGIGLVIVLDQIPKLLGVHFEKGSFGQNLFRLVEALPETSLATLAVASATLVAPDRLERFFPRAPAPLVAVAGGIAAVALLRLHRARRSGTSRRPSRLTLPDVSLVAQLWPGALGIALMSFTETIAAARVFARSDEPPLRANQELLATGLANAGGALLGSMPAGGGTSQTAVNRSAGARTQLAAIVTAAMSLVVDAAARSADRADAAGHAGRGGDRVLDRLDPARRVPRDPSRAAHGVRVGGGRARGRRRARNAPGNPRRGRRSRSWRSLTRWPIRPSTCWAESRARTSSAPGRPTTPRTRPSRGC